MTEKSGQELVVRFEYETVSVQVAARISPQSTDVPAPGGRHVESEASPLPRQCLLTPDQHSPFTFSSENPPTPQHSATGFIGSLALQSIPACLGDFFP